MVNTLFATLSRVKVVSQVKVTETDSSVGEYSVF